MVPPIAATAFSARATGRGTPFDHDPPLTGRSGVALGEGELASALGVNDANGPAGDADGPAADDAGLGLGAEPPHPPDTTIAATMTTSRGARPLTAGST
jgi:hypothetical protein